MITLHEPFIIFRNRLEAHLSSLCHFVDFVTFVV
jgi:hypothetical protein